MTVDEEDWDAFNRVSAAIDMLSCACGHHVEEHEPVGGGAGGCQIEGCECVHFEADFECGELTDA